MAWFRFVDGQYIPQPTRGAPGQKPRGWWGWVAIGRARSARGELTRAIEDTPGGL